MANRIWCFKSSNSSRASRNVKLSGKRGIDLGLSGCFLRGMRKSRWFHVSGLVPGLFLLASFSGMDRARAIPDAPALAATNTPGHKSPDFVAGKIDSSLQLVPPSDPRFRYEGRIDNADPAGPVIVWQGSRVAIDFEGSQLALRFDCLEGQSFFDVGVDGTKCILAIRDGNDQRFVFQAALGRGRHRLTLFKRSEASAGTVRFRGIDLAAGARAWLPAPPVYKLTMEFIGDSITVGACDEDGDADQWDNRQTHNNALSYGALTAAAFSADYRNIAVSGMGVVTGWVDVRAGQIWDRLYPKASSSPADLNAWKPDVLFVNLGENDDSYSRARGKAFPETFAVAYVSLVHAIRKAYPSARIILLRGGMYGGSQSAALRDAWQTAVARLEAADPAINHFVFTHWTRNHPRVADHRAMADELIAWLRAQDFMRNHSSNH